MKLKFKKYDGNPILKPNEKNDWEERCVLNPAVVYDDKNDEIVMVYRAAGNDVRHQIKLGLATSKDGVHFTRQSDKPVFEGHHDDPDGGCVEDPRLVKLDGLYYMTYAARAYAPGQYWLPEAPFPPIYLDETDMRAEGIPTFADTNITVTYLAATKDFRTYKKFGRISETDVDDRDVVIFPERVNGKYVMVSRPKFKDAGVKMPSIWIQFGGDLMSYDKPELLMTGETWWETQRIGAGTPPIKTEEGWLMLYHGVDNNGVYRDGAVLLDLDDPRKIIARTKDFLMEPEFEYENSGIYNGCVFPTGWVEKDGTLYIYYGCADTYVSLATIGKNELIDYLLTECKL